MESSPKLKTLLLPKWFPSHLDPLDGIFVLEHAKAIALHCDVCVLYVHSNHELEGRLQICESQEHGFLLFRVYFRPFVTGFHRLDQIITGLNYLFAQWKGYKMAQRSWGVPSITHVHVLSRTALLAIWLKFSRAIPYVITEHWTGFVQENSVPEPWKLRFMAQIVRHASAITAVSRFLEDALKELFPAGNYKLVPNTCDSEVFRIGTWPTAPKRKKRLIHISTLNDRQKNFSQILKTIHRLSISRDDFELHVFGTGKETEVHRDEARNLALKDKVIFHGLQPKEVIADYLSKSDLLVLFSHYETQSCVAIEALMSGVPVLTSNIGGVNEVVNEGNGILVPPKDSAALFTRLQEFLNGDRSFDPNDLRNQAMKYCYSDVGDQFLTIYKTAIAR